MLLHSSEDWTQQYKTLIFGLFPHSALQFFLYGTLTPKDKTGRKRVFFGTDYGYAMVYAIAIAMLVSGIALSFIN